MYYSKSYERTICFHCYTLLVPEDISNSIGVCPHCLDSSSYPFDLRVRRFYFRKSYKNFFCKFFNIKPKVQSLTKSGFDFSFEDVQWFNHGFMFKSTDGLFYPLKFSTCLFYS